MVLYMNKNKETQSSDEGVDDMSTNFAQPISRYCSVSDSLRQSCKEVKLIREGKLPEKTWRQLKAELKKLKDDDL